MLIDEITKTATATVPDTAPKADTATTSTTIPEVKAEPAKKKPDIIDNDTARLLTDRLLNATRLKKQPKAEKEVEKKEPEAAPAEDKKTEPEAKKPTKKLAEPKVEPKPEPKPEPLDYERIGKEVGKAVRDATKHEEKDTPEPSAEAQTDEAKTVRYLERMEKENPSKYKDISKKYADGLKRSAEYQAKWEKENPGEKFDKADSQHDAFFEQNAVDWDDKDYIEAVADVKADERTQKIRDELAAKERAARLEPEVRKASAETTRSLIESLGGKDAASAIDSDGNIDPDKWKAFSESEPEKAAVLERAAMASKAITAEVENLFNGTVRFNPQNKLHADISNFALAAERSMLAQPESARTQDGKMFVDAKTYDGMSAKERAQHWTFTSRDLRFLAAQDIEADAKKEISSSEERFAQWAKRKGMSKSSDKAASEQPKQEPEKTQAKPVSPTTTVEPKMASRGGNAVSTKEEAEMKWKERFLGRKLTV